jgi:hypothetical protein
MGGMQGNPETGGPMGPVGNWVLIAFLYCLREEKQKFPRKKKCLLANYHLLGPPAVSPSEPSHSLCHCCHNTLLFIFALNSLSKL